MAYQPAYQPVSSTATVRSEVMSFRIAELQAVAEKLGLRKTGERPAAAVQRRCPSPGCCTAALCVPIEGLRCAAHCSCMGPPACHSCVPGRKGELQGRILQFFGELDSASAAALGRSAAAVRPPQQQWKLEQAARVVHDVYRRMRGLPPAAAPASDTSAYSSLAVPAAAAAAAAAALAGPYSQQHAAPPPAMQQQHTLGTPGRLAQAGSQPGAAGVAGSHRPAKVRCICNVPGERGRMVMCMVSGSYCWLCLSRIALGATSCCCLMPPSALRRDTACW